MKKYAMAPLLLLVFMLSAGCKKNGDGVNYILREEFASVHLLPGDDWKFVNNNAPGIAAQWVQGQASTKGYPPAFPARSYKRTESEYAFISGYYPFLSGPADISSWMITAPVIIRDGDLIQFYTRSSLPASTDRLQLLLNETGDSDDVGNTPASMGAFTKILLDINANQSAGNFPNVWTLQSVTIAGLNGTVKTRLAFRYVVSGLTASSIGVDQFSITRK